MKKLLENPNPKLQVRPYGFPPALWIALGHKETMITHEERTDPLCRFMMLSCSPRNRLDFEEVNTSHGTDWKVNGITLGYKNELRARRDINDGHVRDELRRMDGYRRRPAETHSRNLVMLPEQMRRSERDSAVQRHGIDGAIGLANTAINHGDV